MNITSDSAATRPGNGRDEARAEAERIKEAGKQAASRAKSGAEDRLDQGRRTAAAAASDTSAALGRAAETFAAEGQDTLAQATTALAAKLSNLGRYVETHSLDDLTREAQGLARRNPALFIAGGVALGLALSRFLKATPERDEADDTEQSSSAGYRPSTLNE